MKVTISRSSWHYRMTEGVWGVFNKDPGNSLCTYFWQAVLSPVIALGLTILALIVIFGLIFFLFYVVGDFISHGLWYLNILPDTFNTEKVFNWRFIMVSVLFDASVMALVAFNELVLKRTSTKTKSTNVVVAFVKAKKNKICPIIEYKD